MVNHLNLSLDTYSNARMHALSAASHALVQVQPSSNWPRLLSNQQSNKMLDITYHSTKLMKKDPTSYTEWREHTEQRFTTLSLVSGSTEHYVSPSGRFALDVSVYSAGEGSWNYSRGVLKDAISSKVIADIKRNYAMFWYCWVMQEQDEYLICGEDYQGYNVINLNNGTNLLTFPPEALKGMGFCWAAVHPSPDGKILAVEGCYWGSSYELVFVDFSDPMKSPLPELKRFANLDTVEKWISHSEFRFTAYEDEDENPPSRSMVWSRGSTQ
jgi:hypothetical protein